MEPIYAFSIAPMYPRPGMLPRCGPHGRWHPPKALGNSLSLPPAYFYFDGNATAVKRELPQGAEIHNTYSIYYDRGVIWTINYDATREQVDDGIESSASRETAADGNGQPSHLAIPDAPSQSTASSDIDDEERRQGDDWAPMSFDHRDGDGDRLSYAGRRQPHLRLCVRRQDQEWARQILSDTCSAQDVTDVQGHGGLIGELPLLIGLMALAIPQGHMAHGLCQAMKRPWTAPQYEREAGWADKRGLVVKTYACPPGSTKSDLIEYEQGRRGTILP